ncbi:hypothetical protein VVT58_22745 (plasmid) [Sphingobium sp. SJ10-10]|uniref:hypothetical protein n=1 Tax=unclassified Sphingobium TaxID=2611147 RepID=UPI001314E730|nr:MULTISPECIES: hypothetical protein [unclassified Sphingobium]MEC6699644.1 hypothetical protein [Sphingobium sp. SJ10-10]
MLARAVMARSVAELAFWRDRRNGSSHEFGFIERKLVDQTISSVAQHGFEKANLQR